VTGTAVFDEADITQIVRAGDRRRGGHRHPRAERDAHLKAPDFFDVAKFPTITFKSKKIESVAPDKFKITGDLTMRGVTKEVTLDVAGTPKRSTTPSARSVWAAAPYPHQPSGLRRDFSKTMDNGGLVVGNDVDVTIDIELVKQAQ